MTAKATVRGRTDSDHQATIDQGPPSIRIAVQVGPSAIHGSGVFITTAVPKRMKLGEVTGTLVRLPQARRDIAGRAVIQLVELSRRWALDCSAGNAFRHLNHACHANCYLRVVGHRVEVYSRGPIAAGSELTVDYRETPHAGGMACACGQPGCRGRL